MDPLWGHSITCRIAVGPQVGRKVLRCRHCLRMTRRRHTHLATRADSACTPAKRCARTNATSVNECRTIIRPTLSEQRLSLTAADKVRYQLKTPYNNGTPHVVFKPHVVFEALDFLARLAALVPRPRVNLTCYHGVFAPPTVRAAQWLPGPGANAERAPRGNALGTAPEARVRHRHRDLHSLRRNDAHHRVHRRSGGD
jgi:hypothetical protein